MPISKTRLCLLAALLLSVSGAAFAQAPSGFEVGGHLSIFRFGDFDAIRAGLGGRLTMDVTLCQGEPGNGHCVANASYPPEFRAGTPTFLFRGALQRSL